MGFHTVDSCRPLSRFIVSLLVLIWVASLPVLRLVGYSSLHCGTIPVNVVILMSMDSDTFLGVTSLHYLFVLAESHLVCTKSSVIILSSPPPPFTSLF